MSSDQHWFVFIMCVFAFYTTSKSTNSTTWVMTLDSDWWESATLTGSRTADTLSLPGSVCILKPFQLFRTWTDQPESFFSPQRQSKQGCPSRACCSVVSLIWTCLHQQKSLELYRPRKYRCWSHYTCWLSAPLSVLLLSPVRKWSDFLYLFISLFCPINQSSSLGRGFVCDTRNTFW